MVAMAGVNAFLVARYVVFGLFTVCNAITCSVAVWNYSLVEFYTQLSQLDIYLIFLGAFSLLSIFTLIFSELLCISATCVWFECAWVTLFWLMELAGGAALIAIQSTLTCPGQTLKSPRTVCDSARVLIAFTWTCAIMLLLYLLALVFLAASHHAEDPTIWGSNVRALRTAAIRHSSSGMPRSPVTTQFIKRPSVEKYNRVRSQPVQPSSRPVGLSAEYKIEPFRLEPSLPVTAAPEQMEIPHPSDLPEAIPLPPVSLVSSYSISPLKKERNVRSWLMGQSDMPREPISSIEYLNSGRPSGLGPVPSQSTSLPMPSPLGDWPRQDVMQLPAKPRRRPLPPSAFEFPRQRLATVTSTDGPSVPSETVVQPRPRRPSGPRQRIPSGDNGHRPVQLELYGVRI